MPRLPCIKKYCHLEVCFSIFSQCVSLRESLCHIWKIKTHQKESIDVIWSFRDALGKDFDKIYCPTQTWEKLQKWWKNEFSNKSSNWFLEVPEASKHSNLIEKSSKNHSNWKFKISQNLAQNLAKMTKMMTKMANFLSWRCKARGPSGENAFIKLFVDTWCEALSLIFDL